MDLLETMREDNDLQVLGGGLVEGGRSGTVFMAGLHHAIHHAVGLDIVGVEIHMRAEAIVIQKSSHRFVN